MIELNSEEVEITVDGKRIPHYSEYLNREELSKEQYAKLYRVYKPWVETKEFDEVAYHYQTLLTSESADFRLFYETRPDFAGEMRSTYWKEFIHGD